MEGEIGEEISLTMAGDWMRGEAGEKGMEQGFQGFFFIARERGFLLKGLLWDG